MFKNAVVIAVLAMLLSACDGAGNKYVGKWVSLTNDCTTLEVVKNGDGYIINVDSEEAFVGRVKVALPGSVKDGVLRADFRRGTLAFVINEKTNNLVGDRLEYRRATGAEKDCHPEAKK